MFLLCVCSFFFFFNLPLLLALKSLNTVHLLLIFSCSVVSNSVIPWTTEHQASLSFTIFRSLLRLLAIEFVMPLNPLIVCRSLLSHLQSYSASASFPMSEFFTSGGQHIGASASASVLSMKIQDFGLISFWIDILAINSK